MAHWVYVPSGLTDKNGKKIPKGLIKALSKRDAQNIIEGLKVEAEYHWTLTSNPTKATRIIKLRRIREKGYEEGAGFMRHPKRETILE